MKKNPAKPLDINLVETALDKLLECYRQAIRAAEFLPAIGRVQDKEYLVEIVQPVRPAKGRIARLRTSLHQTRIRNADWISSRFAVRPLTRMFLFSHIRSKLSTISDRLEVELLASGRMEANTLERLNIVVIKLRDYDKRLAHRRTGWLKLPGWIWPLAVTYLGTLVIPMPVAAITEVMVKFTFYLLGFAMLICIPLFYPLMLGGFRWKRLILLGRVGDVNIGISTNVILRWVPAPLMNTYKTENRLFETLGLPKPREFPWDLVFSPTTILLGSIALIALILTPGLIFSVTKPGWSTLVAVVVLLFMFFFCVRSILRPIFRARHERIRRDAC